MIRTRRIPAKWEISGKNLAIEIALLKDKASRLGFWRTAHGLEVPLKEIGWELDERISESRKKKK